MQRYTIELSFDNHQLAGGKHVPLCNVAPSAVDGSSDSVRSFAKCAAHFSDLSALRAHWSSHDQQRDSSAWWSLLFCVVVSSTFRDVMVAPATGDQSTVSPNRRRRCALIASKDSKAASSCGLSKSNQRRCHVTQLLCSVELLRRLAPRKRVLGFVIPPDAVPVFMMRGESLACRRALFRANSRHIYSLAAGGRQDI